MRKGVYPYEYIDTWYRFTEPKIPLKEVFYSKLSYAHICDEQPADNPEGYILEVDLEYPEDLHDVHNSYPLAPERMMVQKEWMSDYQHDLLGVGAAPTEVEKLVPNHRNKDRYVLHYRNLQLYFWACV